jgi:mono/diheme cytochrome c family protein
MKRIVKRILLAIICLKIAVVVVIFSVAQWRLGRSYNEPLVALSVATTAEQAIEGGRLARVFGCKGCHAESGNVLFDAPNVGRLIAPNLTQVAAQYSDPELVRLIRRGVKRDGTTVIAMPTEALTHMADDDLAAVISWLRSQPKAADGYEGKTQWRALGLVGLALHKVPLGADTPHDPNPPKARNRDASVAEGRYLTSVTCRACHALHETTDNGFGMVTPALADMARAYTLEEFQTLLTTGKASGDREVGLMSEIARGDLAAMTNAERAAVHRYLLSEKADADQ